MDSSLRFPNKFARSDYQVIDTFEAGIVLAGHEIKSVREGRVNLKGSFARLIKDELWLTGMHIASSANSELDPYRVRKLLLHKEELYKLNSKMKEANLTCIPLAAYFKKGKLKIELAVARGKKKHDKREDIKKRDLQRSTQRKIR